MVLGFNEWWMNEAAENKNKFQSGIGIPVVP
jgi:hypothetical protein